MPHLLLWPSGTQRREGGLIHPDRWLVVLRIAVGAWFLKSVVTKIGLTIWDGWLPLPSATGRWAAFMPERVAEFAAGNPIGWYADFLQNVVIPNSHLFANLTAFGEAVVGLGLTLGLLTRLASVVGAAISANYLLSTFWMSPGQMGFHLLLVVSMVAFAVADAGRLWGLDARLARRRARHGRERAPVTADAAAAW